MLEEIISQRSIFPETFSLKKFLHSVFPLWHSQVFSLFHRYFFLFFTPFLQAFPWYTASISNTCLVTRDQLVTTISVVLPTPFIFPCLSPSPLYLLLLILLFSCKAVSPSSVFPFFSTLSLLIFPQASNSSLHTSYLSCYLSLPPAPLPDLFIHTTSLAI